MVVQDVATGRVIGTSRYDCYDADTSEVEIGWTFLDRSLWGGPYNAEMKRLMLDHAFRSVETVLFRVSSENLRSQKAVEKLGATRVGIERTSSAGATTFCTTCSDQSGDAHGGGEGGAEANRAARVADDVDLRLAPEVRHVDPFARVGDQDRVHVLRDVGVADGS